MSKELKAKVSLDSSGYESGIDKSIKKTAELRRETVNANKSMQSFQKSLSGVGNNIGNMMSSFRAGDFSGFITGIRGVSQSMMGIVPAAGGIGGAISGIGSAAVGCLGPIGAIGAAVVGLGAILGAGISKAEEYNKALKSFSALTGVSGNALDEIGNAAIEMSKKFGISAASVIKSMENIGSQAPQLLQDMEGMKNVANAANVLSRADGNIGVEDAAKAITTVMNQLKAPAAEVDEIINSLAAGSQKGAANIEYLNTAIEKAGGQAGAAKMSYQQLVAMIETIAPKFSSAEVAGTSLNAMLVRLSTQTNDNFNPAVVGIHKALDNLAKANLSAKDKVDLFGRASLLAANTLIEERNAFVDMEKAVSGTNTAYEQMETKGGTLSSAWAKMKSTWDALLISIGNSTPAKAIVEILKALIEVVKGVITVFNVCVDAINTAIDIIIALFKKLWDSVKEYWYALVNAITDSAIYKTMKNIWNAIVEIVVKAIKYIKDLWNSFMEWLGLKAKSSDTEVAVKIKADAEGELDNPALNLTNNAKGGKSTKAKIDYDKGSLEDYKKQLSELEAKLTKKKMSLVDVEKTKTEIQKLKDTIEKMEISLGIKPKKGSLAAIDAEISEIDKKIQNLNPSIDYVEIENLQIKKEELKKLREQTQAAIDGVVVKGKQFKSEGAEGSSKYAADKVSYYKTLIDLEVKGSDRYEELKKRLKEWTEKEHKLRLEIDADLETADPNSQKYLDGKLSSLQSELHITAIGTPEYQEMIKEINELTAKKREIDLKVNLDMMGAKKGSLAEIGAHTQKLTQQLELEVYGSDEYKRIKSELDDWTKKENKIKMKIEVDNMDFFDKIETGFEGFHAIDGMVSSFENLSQAIEEGADAWSIFMAAISTIEAILDGINTVMTITNMLSNLGTGASIGNAAAKTAEGAAATEAATMEAATIAPKTAEVIANRALEASILDLAAAQIFLAHAGIPFAGPGIAAGLVSAMMGAMIAQHAASLSLQAFKEGGIVKGTTTIGDYNIVRANKGEMMLNTRQQNNLFRAIDRGNIGGSYPGGKVEFIIKGDKLYGVNDNYKRIYHKK